MDRSIDFLFRLAAPTLALLVIVGCGGGSSDSPAPGAATEPAATAPAANSTDDRPSKPLTEGMMLPDDVAIPTDVPKSDDGKSKGMQLPDDLQPSASRPIHAHENAVRLVATESVEVPTDIRFAAWSQIDAEIKETGKVTVVDFWSLACTPCLREYPQLVALHDRYPNRVRTIAVNLDFDGREKYPAKSYETRIAAFLTAVNATLPNYVAETPSEDVFNAVEIASLPAVLVYDAEGQLVARFSDVTHDGGFDYEHNINPLVTKLLGE